MCRKIGRRNIERGVNLTERSICGEIHMEVPDFGSDDKGVDSGGSGFPGQDPVR